MPHCEASPAFAVVFDLDDTLYLERDYVRSGFRAVARRLGEIGERPAAAWYRDLSRAFRAGVRGDTFDRVLAPHSRTRAAVTTPDLVELYRRHPPTIRPLAGVPALFTRIRRRGGGIGIITDGPWPSQQAKLDALALEARIDTALLTDRWGREHWKPHPRAFVELQAAWGLAGAALTYVGDNPLKDFVAPAALGWRTIRLRLPGQLSRGWEPPGAAHAAGLEVDSLEALGHALEETR